MNIDFSSQPGFSAYVLLLMASGIAMVVLASPAVRRSTMFLRVVNTVVGLAFFGYGFYLTFLWSGVGTYFIFFKAFILPAVLIFRTIQGAWLSRRQAAQAPASPAAATTPAPEVEAPRI